MKKDGTATAWKNDLKGLDRNNFYYGKMMDVHSFELETNYFRSLIYLVDRLVVGYGVICGLDVRKVGNENCIAITRGVAIDRWGRPIIVPETSRSLAIPDYVLPGEKARKKMRKEQGNKQNDDCQGEEGTCIHVVLCYHECESDPTPVLSSDCDDWGTCEAGTISERYRVEFRRGKAKEPVFGDDRFPDVSTGGQLDYKALAAWVTKSCPKLPNDSCIPLANIFLSLEDDEFVFTQASIDIGVRPLAFTRDLIFNLFMDSITEEMGYR